MRQNYRFALVAVVALALVATAGVFKGLGSLKVMAQSVAPTATLTANNSHSITVDPGATITYMWSSKNADTATSTYTIDAPDTCSNATSKSTGPFPWIASSVSSAIWGGLFGQGPSVLASACQAGRTYTITYTVTNSATGQTASDSVTVHVTNNIPHNVSITFPDTVAPRSDVTNFVSLWDYNGNHVKVQLTDTVTGQKLPAGQWTITVKAVPPSPNVQGTFWLTIAVDDSGNGLLDWIPALVTGSWQATWIQPQFSSGDYKNGMNVPATSNTLTIVSQFPPAYTITISPDTFTAGQPVKVSDVQISIKDKNGQMPPDGYYGFRLFGTEAGQIRPGTTISGGLGVNIKSGIVTPVAQVIGTPPNTTAVVIMDTPGVFHVDFVTLWQSQPVPATSNNITVVANPNPPSSQVTPPSPQVSPVPPKPLPLATSTPPSSQSTPSGTPPDLQARQAATLQRIDRRIGALEDTKAALSEASGIPDALESQLSQLIDSLIQDLTTLRDRVSAAQSREEITIANRIVVTITTIQLNIRQLIRNLERLQTLLTQ